MLKKRADYRQAFTELNVSKIATFGEAKHQELYEDPSIICNQIKIPDTVNNA